MTHLESHIANELENKLTNLRKKKIPFKIKICENKVIMVDTKSKELIDYAKKNNPELS
tara:strand:+ start:494 stop:667 length:174 start_codon:yes stop_codon:yes gene_type:complete